LLLIWSNDVNASAPSFIISGSTENVGLGTNKPTSKLHVVGTGNITSDTTIGGTLFCTKINTFDTDTLVEIGRTHVGSVGHGDCAGFSHIDQNSTTNYALLQSSVGNTFLNAASGKKVYFRINNSDIATLSCKWIRNWGLLTILSIRIINKFSRKTNIKHLDSYVR
jgi:hypothetical protein